MNLDKNSPVRRFRLRTTLLIPFLLQIVAGVGLVGWIGYRSGQQAVNNVATQLRSELTNRITEKLSSYTEIPKTINRLNANDFSHGDLNVSNTFGEHKLWQHMQIYPSLSYVYCGDEDGSFFGVGRLDQEDRSNVIMVYSNFWTDFMRQDFAFDEQGNRTEQIGTLEQPYDPRQRPWYKAAQAESKAVWSEIYLSFSTLLPTITASLPVYSLTDGSLIGVCGTDFFLPQEVSGFLRNLEIGKTGTAFIMERSGKLVATSTGEPTFKVVGNDRERLMAIASENGAVRATANYLSDRFNDLGNIQTVKKFDFQWSGERQYVQVVPFQDGNLDWLVVLTIPESDFMSEINASRQKSIGLSLAALIMAIAVGILTSRWVTRPILRVSHAADELAQGELDQQVKPSPIIEIDRLARSFNSMAQQLKQSFSALRQSEATNRAIVNTIPDLMIRAKGDGSYLDVVGSDRLEPADSSGEELLTGQPFPKGISVQEYLPDNYEQLMHYIQQALITGKLQVYEHQIIRDNKSVDEEVRIMVLAEDEVLIMVRDITDRKQAEEALRIAEENYRSIFENALEGIFQSSPKGKFINANPALARIYGYDSPEELMASITNISEQLYVDPEKRTEFRYLLSQQNSVKNFEYRCYCKDRSIIWIQIDARVVNDNNGNVLYYEGIVQDITERKRKEEELKRQLEELQIEIDHKKRQQEVANLTESSYFQEVQQEISNVNLDDFWS
ncbi:MAG: PAS domain S-box protein [Arthrospira platensis PCC 7345]|uniref:histidine kinase n=1 Tax=Limnospira platensis NIES-46 TaxID=1236695 RepID=A0A5M3TFH0_LIMPL|nr:PAS domain S-box protein [Arthrospira platensis]MDF2209525.1 PAS domain S-box protein [Arthrospira platensis NCB002]MDT9297096.1 PAS domain S-box protein [Arthrospira platensis PCC 7345]BAI90265.1 putative PAS/PAC sensor protein [Arthrospira platensis NIES-39]BDT12579.1 putative PAS/PAC sensor protein [Arthrospira platensis NIES-39]GCE96798.1 putative PAS/PAC sensor protein [Arthrospira platensis NIES-46]